jgi:hypothetical protein
LHQLTYISTAPLGTTEQAVEAILATSRQNNRRDAITGLLISDGTRFLQVLEGDIATVEATFTRIRSDPRHRAAVVLGSKSVSDRHFGRWDMAFAGFGRSVNDVSLGDAVDRLVAGVRDPNVRALFSSFARIDRSQAA